MRALVTYKPHDFPSNHYSVNGVVPTVYDTCKAFKLETEGLEALFGQLSWEGLTGTQAEFISRDCIVRALHWK